MKKKDIYIGTILKNENKEVKTFQKYNQLLDIGNGYYINLDWIKSLKDKIKLYKGLVTNKYSDELVIYNMPPEYGIFVDQESLVPYYKEDKDKNIGVNTAQKDKLMDVRIPGGVEVNVSEGTTKYYHREANPNKHKTVKAKTR